MGQTSPPIPKLPPAPIVALNMDNPVHAEAYARFEAEREVDAISQSKEYRPLPKSGLFFYDGKVNPYERPAGPLPKNPPSIRG